ELRRVLFRSAQALADQSAKDHAAFAETRRSDHARYRAIVQNALDEAASTQSAIETMIDTLRDALGQIDQMTEETQAGNEETSGVSTESPEQEREIRHDETVAQVAGPDSARETSIGQPAFAEP